jgi:hypothetical protein
MHRVIFGLAGLLAVVGVSWVWSGSGQVLNERGWSSVIAGSSLVAGGAITFAIGVLVMKLDAMSAAVTQTLLSAPPQAVEPPPIARAIEPTKAPDAAPSALTPPERRHAAEPGPAPPAAVREAAAAPEPSPPEPPPPAPADPKPARPQAPGSAQPPPPAPVASAAPKAAQAVPPEPKPAPSEPKPVSPEPKSVPTEQKPPPPPSSSAAPVAATIVAPLAAAAAPPPASSKPPPTPSDALSQATPEWLDLTLSGPMRPSIEPEPAAPPPVVEAPAAPADAPASTPARPPEPTPQNIGLDKPQPTEIGRYASAGTTYVMYSDGSIEAENESGVLRFPSMAALKAYIERKS